MEPIPFPEQTCIYARNQPQYRELPAHQFGDVEGRIAFCWSLTLRERVRLLLTGRLWQQVMTWGQPLQPQLLTLDKPPMEKRQ